MEIRRIVLDGEPAEVTRQGDVLVTSDGRHVPIDDATHLAPVQPSKIVCIHLNYESRVKEFLATLPPAPTYFHKPVTALNVHDGDVVRPPRCRFLNYEGEIA
ncbi:MAG TPA: fumarylacetoacetate hydrolase family protein, partial [Actinomycetota bacterium]